MLELKCEVIQYNSMYSDLPCLALSTVQTRMSPGCNYQHAVYVKHWDIIIHAVDMLDPQKGKRHIIHLVLMLYFSICPQEYILKYKIHTCPFKWELCLCNPYPAAASEFIFKDMPPNNTRMHVSHLTVYEWILYSGIK